MSEPQTSAKVIIYTVKGRIDVELWAKEKPVHTRRFLEACRGGLLVDESFDRLSDTHNCLMLSKQHDMGTSESPSLEHNARIRWRTGSLGWDSADRKWFITVAPLNDDNSKVVIGKIVDDSIYSLRKIVDDSEVDSDGKLLYPATIRKIEVTIPYFDDLPSGRAMKAVTIAKQLPKVAKVKISFDDDDEDEDESIQPMKRMKIKMPAAIAEPSPALRVSGKSGTESETEEEELEEANDKQEESGCEDVEPESKESINESGVSDRERETLKLLALFEQKTKDKTILKR